MKSLMLPPSRLLPAVVLFLSLAAFAHADSIYVVNVQLGESNSQLLGQGATPISNGSVTDTFSTNLPVSGSANITNFDFTFYDSSGNVLGTLSSSDAQQFMLQSIFTTQGCFGAPGGGCDSFTAGATNGGGPNFQFLTPLGFTGGNIAVGFTNNNGAILSDAAIGTDTAGIVSGTILAQSAVPEPATLVLLGSGLLVGLWVERKRLLGRA
jgi:hypothetical protein